MAKREPKKTGSKGRKKGSRILGAKAKASARAAAEAAAASGEEMKSITQILEETIARKTPQTAADARTFFSMGATEGQLARAIEIQVKNEAKRAGLPASEIALLSTDDYRSAAAQVRAEADALSQRLQGASPKAAAAAAPTAAAAAPTQTAKTKTGKAKAAKGLKVPSAPRAPQAPTVGEVAPIPEVPGPPSPAAKLWQERQMLGGKRLGAGGLLLGAPEARPEEAFGEAVEELRTPRKTSTDTVPGVVTERAKRGHRLPRADVQRRYRKIFGRGVRAGRRLHLGPTVPKQLLRLGGMALVAPMVANAVSDLMGADEERELRRARLQFGVQALQRRLDEGILSPGDMMRKQRIQDAVDFKTMMLTQRDPSLAQLMMGLPETTQAEFIVGAKPDFGKLRSVVEQETLEQEVARELD